MSTEYNYDEQVAKPQPPNSFHDHTDTCLGPVLPILHSDSIGVGPGAHHNHFFDAQEEYASPFHAAPQGYHCADANFYELAEKDTTKPLVNTGFQPPNSDLIAAARRRQAKRERNLRKFVLISAGWALFAYMLYLIITTEATVNKIWNPYDILGISEVRSRKYRIRESDILMLR